MHSYVTEELTTSANDPGVGQDGVGAGFEAVNAAHTSGTAVPGEAKSKVTGRQPGRGLVDL